jgi:hypothetical protein
MFSTRTLVPRRRLCRWAIIGVALGLSQLHAEPQFSAGEQAATSPSKNNRVPSALLPREFDPLRGSSWGPGGPWAEYAPYMPRPKPAGWIDPEPSRWPWTGERDPYDYPYPSRSDDAASAGQDDETDGAKSAYPNSPPP